jgi:hypothetical protein
MRKVQEMTRSFVHFKSKMFLNINIVQLSFKSGTVLHKRTVQFKVTVLYQVPHFCVDRRFVFSTHFVNKNFNRPDDGGSTDLLNVGKLIPVYTARYNPEERHLEIFRPYITV